MAVDPHDPDSLNERLGEIITERRQRLGLSQAEAARRAGLSRAYYFDVERGLRNISVVSLIKIAAALECKAVDILGKVAGRARLR